MRACVRFSTPVVFLVDDHHCADVAYADILHTFITLFPHEEVLILTEQFREELIQDEHREYMKNELNRKYNKDKQPSRSLLYSNVLHKITRFLPIYVTINDLTTYYNWISHFPALEVKTQVVFIEDPSRDQLMTMA